MTGSCSVLSLCRETSRSYLRFRGRPYQEKIFRAHAYRV